MMMQRCGISSTQS